MSEIFSKKNNYEERGRYLLVLRVIHEHLFRTKSKESLFIIDQDVKHYRNRTMQSRSNR